MTLSQLQALIDSGDFHHATYRNQGTLWEGLWIYKKSDTGFNGYEPVANFSKSSPDCDAAHEICAGTGISLGSYGQG